MSGEEVSGTGGSFPRREDVEAHLPYVRRLAMQVHARLRLGEQLSREDLVQYGVEGLIAALKRFDPSHGASIRTYSHYRILGAMHDGVRRAGIGRRRSARSRFHALADAYLSEAMEARPLGTAGLIDMVADLAAMYATAQGVSAPEPVERGPGPAEQAERSERREQLLQALEQLDERERRLIDICYFRDGSLQDAADALGLSKSWVSRIHAKAVGRLRRALVRSLRGRPSQPSGDP